MVLALGLYDEFIDAVSDLTRFRISLRPVVVIGMLFAISAATIVLFSTVMQFLMEMFLPGMLGLFIGMTLGGAPLLLAQLRPMRAPGLVASALGIVVMALIAFVLRPDNVDPNFALYFLGGILGSAAMILPGISGSYLLLIFGLYLPIIGGISDLTDALRAGDFSLFVSITLGMVLPVGLGVVTGIVALSNLLKYLLHHYHKPTVGFLLGLLLGSVLGLYPFQQASFDKLPRYALTRENGMAELMVRGFGWMDSENDFTAANLRALEDETLRVNIIEAREDGALTVEDVERARGEEAVLIAYDVSVPREVRRAAADEEKGEVELVIVPNTEYSPARGILVVVLIGLGYMITYSLGRFGEKRETRAA